jgi:hypothetical protein
MRTEDEDLADSMTYHSVYVKIRVQRPRGGGWRMVHTWNKALYFVYITGRLGGGGGGGRQEITESSSYRSYRSDQGILYNWLTSPEE